MIPHRAISRILLASLSIGMAQAVDDPGQAEVAMLQVTVYHATNGDPAAAGPRARPVSKEIAARLSAEERLRFEHYRVIGQDTQPVLRSYENWAEPLKPSDEVLVRFEAQGHADDRSAVLDLELWLSRKKIIKVDARLECDRPIYLLGPQWRGGHLIISVKLVPMDEKEED